jgi:anaerobic selenocysteine-containing dehydrogenase
MTGKLSRREFLKTAGIGAAATAVLTGCGPASRYLVREPYTRMPEYTYNGQSTYYASTCRECPAGCGIVVRTEQGRALKIEGNPINPVNQGKTCARGQVALQGLYNPDRYQYPAKQEGRGSQIFTQIDWDGAVGVVQAALQNNAPNQIAFLLGMTSDYLFDLVSELCAGLGAPPPIRYGAHEIFDGRLTLAKAVETLFSASSLPYFDLANADVTFSFSANFLETYLSPVAYARGFAHMRRGTTGKRGYLVQFEPRLSQTAASADEWIPVAPGSEGLVALAIGRLIAEFEGKAIPPIYVEVDINNASSASGVPVPELQRLASIFHNAAAPLAIAGGAGYGSSNSLESTQAVLALNALMGNLGKPGGVYLEPAQAVRANLPQLPNSMVEVSDLTGRMRQGEIKVLFVHGINPVFELPAALGFKDALAGVSQVISFASFPDETSLQSDYVLPDHTALESWGYQKASGGADRLGISGSQPTVAPYYSTKATADVLLAAVQVIGGDLAKAVPYTDVVDYMESALVDLVTLEGFYNAPDIKYFMPKFQQFGGWWAALPGLTEPNGTRALQIPISAEPGDFNGSGEFFLFPFMSPIFGDGGGANKPWLQEIPDPTTTVMWNSWVEINPVTAEELGITDDDVVKLTTSAGEIEVVVYRYPAIHPGTIAIPFGQGHTAYGRYAQERGINPGNLVALVINGADDLAFRSTKVTIEKTGRTQSLSRLESRMGVYGE